MSKKDYVAIATAVSEAVVEYDPETPNGVVSLNNLIDELSIAFSDDNGLFDRVRFTKFIYKRLDERFQTAEYNIRHEVEKNK